MSTPETAVVRKMVYRGSYTFCEIVAGNLPFDGSIRPVVAKVKCADGTTLSVQASDGHYCKPRHNYGPYYELEVGYPSAEPPQSWRTYFDGDWESDDHKESVYGYVPVEEIACFIRSHGGEK